MLRLPVTLTLKRSRSLAVALAVAYGLATAGLWLAELPMAVKLVFAGGLALSLFFLRVRRSSGANALTLHADGHLTLCYPDGRMIDGEADPGTTVFPWLIVLCVRTAKPLVLPVDALGDEGHRQLRLWLRWKTKSELA